MLQSPLPPVTVSIVSHGQWSMICSLLEQLDHWCAARIAKVVITVNRPEPIATSDSSTLPLEMIHNASPRGFGANHNAAFKRCETPWFLVLNPDIRIDLDVLSLLLAAASDKSGLLTPRIFEPGQRNPEPYRDLLTPLELVRRRHPAHVPPAHPAWVAGMFMLLRSEAFAAVGGFDERYFMYCEDVDLCARLRLAGWDFEVGEYARVLHEAQRASNSSLKPLLWHLHSLGKLWCSPAFWRYATLLRRTRP